MDDSGTCGHEKEYRPESGDIRPTAPFGKSGARALGARSTALGLKRGLAVLGLALLAATAAPALALPTSPSLKPRMEFRSAWLDPRDLAALKAGLEQADLGQWSDVRSAAARVSDPAAKLILRWRLATGGGGALPFSEASRLAEEFKDWPDSSQIFEQAERTIAASALEPADRIAWLKQRGPRTGEGVLALASALRAVGRTDEAQSTVRNAWRAMALSEEAQARLLSTYGGELTPEDHWARTDMLIWRGAIREAEALLPRISDGRRRLAQARIALRQNKRNVDALIDAVPSELLNDPGLCYERARWRERKGLQTGELEMLVKIRGSDAAPAGRRAIWLEKHQVLRRLIREGDVATAYQLATDHGLTEGEDFRDAEWTAGWLALKLKDPVKAEAHFRVFGNGVVSPISVARANYWLGEALSAQGRSAEAQTAYEAAARHPYVFYGQLAAEKAGQARPELKTLAFEPLPPPSDADRAEFASRPMVKAAILLGEAGRVDAFERLSNRIDDTLSTALEHQMLFDIGQTYLETRTAVRGAKAGFSKGLIAPDAVFPVLPLPPSTRTGAAEPALVLALSRQESELYPPAISSADARGMMQMIPRFAQAEARKVGIPFRTSWLTDDPTYNLQLGRGFLDALVQEFGGSYILAAAAYNAGPSRARQWIAEFGDPRGEVDPVEWIETIPFAETRNYVQRVMENMLVYRHRLTEKPAAITLSRDLARGRRS